MEYNEVIILDPTEDKPVKVEQIGNSISISDHVDEVHLTEYEATKLVRILIDHFNIF